MKAAPVRFLFTVNDYQVGIISFSGIEAAFARMNAEYPNQSITFIKSF